MSAPSKVLVLDPDPRAGRQLQLGFEREGLPVDVRHVPVDGAKLELGEDEPSLVIVGGADGRGLDLVRRTRQLLSDSASDVPIVFVGRGASRGDLVAAGADEIVMQPAYLRDVVTIGRLLRGVPAKDRDHLVGNLVETTGVLTLVRALAALGRSAVLTLIRGLRRGEIRFFNGEVTSAQVGLIHGQAALHQLLLWTDARFDFSHEDLVRRQQIPLSPEELFADAERFLESVRETAGGLSPATVLEQDVQRVHNLGKQIPTEVHGVLRMFDGHRVLADVLEDSPYRVFETLRVAQKAVEIGLLKVVDSQRPKTAWRTVLAIEEWLVGQTRDEVVERTSRIDTPVPGQPATKKKFRKGRRSSSPPQNRSDIDWGALVPRVIGAEVGPLSGVVPAQASAGEIDIATRAAPREKLEALMDTDKREKIFPTDIGIEASVVIAPEPEPEPEPEPVTEPAPRSEPVTEPAPRSEPEPAPPPIDQEAAKAATIEASRIEAELRAEDEARQAKEAAERQAARVRDETQAKVKEAVERMRLEREQREAEEAKTRQEAARNAAAQEAREWAAKVKAAAEAKRAADEAKHSAVSAGEAPVAAPTVAAPSPAVSHAAVPTTTEDDPSDGVVRAMIATADTARLARARERRPSPPEFDGPPVKEATGTIEPRAEKSAPKVDQPSILVEDLAAAHNAIAAAMTAPPAPYAPPVDAKSRVQERVVAEARKDAQEFSDAEEAFFRKADHSQPVPHHPQPHVESFSDLDEGYEPPKFWDRVFGRGRRRASTEPPPDKK